jgi:hypothetical protein
VPTHRILSGRFLILKLKKTFNSPVMIAQAATMYTIEIAPAPGFSTIRTPNSTESPPVRYSSHSLSVALRTLMPSITSSTPSRTAWKATINTNAIIANGGFSSA